MKTSLVFVGLACSLYADTTVNGPSLGYVSSGSVVRKVLGIAGASQLSNPVLSNVQRAAVLSGTNVSVAVDASGALVHVDLSTGSTTELGVQNVTTIISSPSGEMALAIAEDRAHVFSRAGSRVAELALPGSPLLVAVADRGRSVALTVAEFDKEVLYVVNEQGSRRVLTGTRFPALAFLPHSVEFVVSNEAGVISRVDGNLQFRHVATARGAKALGVTQDHSRLVIVAGQTIRAVRLATGEETSLDCRCAAVMARPLGDSSLLLTTIGDGPIWLVDASADELRVVFIPEAANE